MDLQEKANVAINKAQYTYKDKKYSETIISLQNAHSILQDYYNSLPNYLQYQYKVHFTVIVSDIYAQQALCEFFQQNFEKAQNKLQKSLFLVPDQQLYFIKAAIFAGVSEPENLILALNEGKQLINRSYLNNQIKVTSSVILALKLFISSKTNNYQRTYQLLSNLLDVNDLANIEYLAIIESMRCACEQFHQIPVALQCTKVFNIPGIQDNQITDFQKVEFWAYNMFKMKQGDITLPGTEMNMYQIFLFYIPQLGDFQVSQIEQYMQQSVLVKQIWKNLSKMSRVFMGMVKLSNVKDIKSDLKMVSEQDFRNYIFEYYQGKNLSLIDQKSSLPSNSQKDSNISNKSFTNRKEQDLLKRKYEYTQPVQIFESKQEQQKEELFQSVKNIQALSSRDSNLLNPQKNLKISQTPIIDFGNGKSRTNTQLVNNNQTNKQQLNLIKIKSTSNQKQSNKYQNIQSKYHSYFADIKTISEENQLQIRIEKENKEFLKSKQICQACDRIIPAVAQPANFSELQNFEYQRDKIHDQIIGFELQQKKDEQIQLARKQKTFIDYPKLKSDAIKFQSQRKLELKLEDDDLLQSFKQKLNDSRLLLTNFDDYQKVLYVNDKQRPQYQNDDPDFTDLFAVNTHEIQTPLNKKFSFNISTKNLENLNLSQLNAPPLNERLTEYDDQNIGDQLLSKFKTFEKFQFTKFDRPVGKYISNKNDQIVDNNKPVKIESSILKQKLDEIAKLNAMRYNNDKEIQKQLQKHGSRRKPFKYQIEELKDCELQKYFRTNRSSFIFNIK